MELNDPSRQAKSSCKPYLFTKPLATFRRKNPSHIFLIEPSRIAAAARWSHRRFDELCRVMLRRSKEELLE